MATSPRTRPARERVGDIPVHDQRSLEAANSIREGRGEAPLGGRRGRLNERDENRNLVVRAAQAGMSLVGGPLGMAMAGVLELMNDGQSLRPEPNTLPQERQGRRPARDDEDSERVLTRAMVRPPDEEEDVAVTVQRPATNVEDLRARRRRALGTDTAERSITRRRRVIGV